MIGPEQVKKLGAGCTVVMSSYDASVDGPVEQKVSSQWTSLQNGQHKDKVQLVLNSEKRVSDQFYVDIFDSQGSKLSAEVIVSVNLHKSSKAKQQMGISQTLLLYLEVKFHSHVKI